MQNNNPSNTPAENKMGVQPVGRLLAGMAVPMMISMLVQALYNVVDSIFVSRLSENALTAVSLAFPLQNLMIAVCAGTTVGMNALLSRSLGAKEQDKADQAANTGIFLALCSFVLFCVIGVFFSRTFFQLQTDVTEIVSSGTIYAQICLGCSIGIFCQFTFERLLQSTGRTHLSMCTQLLGALTNIILDPILIFGLFGAPRLGVAGAAVATVTGQCVAAVAALIMNLKCNPDIHIVPRKIRFHGPTVKNIYRIGFPSIVMQCIGSVMVFGVNRILISFTTTATAVFGAYFKLQSFIFMPVFGLNNGMVPIVAYNYGAKKPDRVKRPFSPRWLLWPWAWPPLNWPLGPCSPSSTPRKTCWPSAPRPCGSSPSPSCWQASASSPCRCARPSATPYTAWWSPSAVSWWSCSRWRGCCPRRATLPWSGWPSPSPSSCP